MAAAKKQGNMFGSFGTAAEQREKEQRKIEAAVTGQQEPVRSSEKRVTFMLAMTELDKFDLKEYALKQGRPVSAIIHDWIDEHCRGKGGTTA